jgi:transposase
VNFAEITHPDYPGERLVACRGRALATQRARKRTELLAATEVLLMLGEVKAAVEREARPWRGQDKIALRVGRVLNRHKMAKHFELVITDDSFSFSHKEGQILAEAALDGFYVVRASASGTSQMSAAELVGAYKDLRFNEAGFRSLKAIDLDLRPIYHYTEARVRAHVFICMLALYLV